MNDERGKANHSVPPRVSVIILNWNGRQFLRECLDSIYSQTFADFEVVLVDNGSTDDSVNFVQNEYPWVNLVELPLNFGFAEGNFRGFAVSRGEFIITLNNDTTVEPEFIAALVSAMDADTEAGLVAAKMRNYYRRDTLDSIGLQIARNGLGYNVGIGEIDSGQYMNNLPVFGPCGGAAMYRRSMLESVGFFDVDFFAYYEDFDLAWRARLAGWKCRAAVNAIVYHVHSATSGEMSSFKVYYTHRNKWYAIIKNWPFPLLLTNFPRIVFYDVASFLFAIMYGKGWSAFRARIDVVRHINTLLNKRREIQQSRTLDDEAVACLFSAHESPFKTFYRKRVKILP